MIFQSKSIYIVYSCWFLPVVVWDVPFVGPNLVAIYPVACELLNSLLFKWFKSVGPFITCLHLKLKWLQPLSFNWTTCRPPPSDARKINKAGVPNISKTCPPGMVEGNLLDEPVTKVTAKSWTHPTVVKACFGEACLKRRVRWVSGGRLKEIFVKSAEKPSWT